MAIYKEFARVYLEIARKDLESALKAFNIGDYPEAVFHAQQCVEKAVKAMLECKKKWAFNHGPLLLSVFEDAFKDEWCSNYDVVVEALDYLRDFYTSTRYPKLLGDKVYAPWDIVGRREAVKALEYAREVLEVATRYLREKSVI